MSISDIIVVMKYGVVQQIGAPQEVYDSPDNLFVAKFLGTPPINVFDGKVTAGKLYIGEEMICSLCDDVNSASGSKGNAGAKQGDAQNGTSAESREVYVGIRPEGFELKLDGALTCDLHRVEVMGRDISVVCSHKACEAENIRAIISAENMKLVGDVQVKFDVKPDKLFLFDKVTGERLCFSMTK